MYTLQYINIFNKKNSRNSQYFDKIFGAIDDLAKHKKVVVMDNLIQLKYQFVFIKEPINMI